VWRVTGKGELKWKNERIFISEIFGQSARSSVTSRWGRPVDERYAEVRFGPVLLGWLDGSRHMFHRRLSLRVQTELGLKPSYAEEISPAGRMSLLRKAPHGSFMPRAKAARGNELGPFQPLP